MKNKEYANSLRRLANTYEVSADKWLKFAKNKQHSKALRIKAAQRYRDNIRWAAKYREMAKKYE